MKYIRSIFALLTAGLFLQNVYAQSDLKVQMILTKKYVSSFEEAQKNATDEIVDGDPLWLYIKSNKPFKEFATVRRISQSDGSVLKYYSLLLKLGPNSDWAPYNDNCVLCFGNGKECANLDRVSPEMLDKSEMILNLTTYDSKGSSKVMLSTVGNGMPGNWDNQVRLYVNDDLVAKARLNCKVEDGIAKYKQMWATYKDKLAKGDENSNELPKSGSFVNASIQGQVMQFMKQRGITPTKVYFTQNNWTEVDESSIDRHRYITAVVTYQKSGKCFFSIVQVRQNYSFSATKYGNSNLNLQDKDMPVRCK